ncbi:hypothetical protein P7K49_005093 [Saguinus oedipus]|uniref:ERAP1-like C-terminal domain-containing protein n=1 Tax=Saguinus oedipus TaxID=9490 RepID=A0ABQ9WA44_SAGOE|nr:hypothetical protein P7K49_005093 [Saguinus oedipus]
MKAENFKTSEIVELFDIFAYSKGASMARMLSSFLNNHLFVSALKAIDDQSTVTLPATIKDIMDSWTQQSGFPVITLNVSTGIMKQEPFYLEKVKNQTLLTNKNNYIEIETALELTKYLAEEDEIIVWHTVLVNLVTKDLVSDVKNSDLYPLLKKYLLKRLNSIWNIYVTIIRENVLVLQDDYLALIPYPIKEVVLCYGIALGSDKEWDILLNIYTNTTKEEEKLQLIYAMSCSKDPWILNRYMEYAISASPFTSNETNIIEIVAASDVGWYVAKDFLVNNWQAVSESNMQAHRHHLHTEAYVGIEYIIDSGAGTSAPFSQAQNSSQEA